MTRSLISPVAHATNSASLSAVARAFCENHGLLPFVDSIAGAVHVSFDLAEPPAFSTACDPESGEEWLEVSATARGSVREIRDAYHGFTSRWLASMPAVVQDRVRLILLAE